MSDWAPMAVVKMADNEWGNELMNQLARQYLTEFGHSVVEIDEHAGWWMTFVLDNGEPLAIGSANCSAVVSDRVKQLRQLHAEDLNGPRVYYRRGEEVRCG